MKIVLAWSLSFAILGAQVLPIQGFFPFKPALMLRAEAQTSQKRVALIIGNQDYGFAPLQNTLNDSRDMANKLRSMGFEVIQKENLTDDKSMTRALLEATAQIQPGGVFLFYYSGHGMQVNGQNYLLPTKAQVQKESDVEFESLQLNRVLAEIESAHALINIVILDACRDNPFGRGFKSAGKGLAGITRSPSGTFIAFATAPGEVASDNPGGRNGLFTEALLQNIDRPGLTIEQVFKYSAREVRKKGQQPWSNSSLVDDFYFVPRTVESTRNPGSIQSGNGSPFKAKNYNLQNATDRKFVEDKANQGDAYFQAILGQALLFGIGLKQDIQRGKALVGKSAQAQNPLGMYVLCHAYDTYEIFGDTKRAEARGLCQKSFAGLIEMAKRNSDPYAQQGLGYVYAMTSEDYVEGAKWTLRSAEQGLVVSQLMMALAYAFGTGVRRDEAEALKWNRKAAEQGDAHGQYAVGISYEISDRSEAMKWYQKAAAQGHEGALKKIKGQ